MAIFWLIVAALLLFNFAVQSALLWISCRLCRARRLVQLSTPLTPVSTAPITYRRTLLATLILVAVNLPLAFLDYRLDVLPKDSLAVCIVIAVAANIILCALVVLVVMPLRVWKSLLVGAAWFVLSFGYILGFVFVLTFFVEAFVNNTGSMAENLLGYHRQVQCPSCDYTFSVNCSAEADPVGHASVPILGCTCPNCRQTIRLVPDDRHEPPRDGVIDGFREIPAPEIQSGDRFIVRKTLIAGKPQRLDLITFTFPDRPEIDGVPQRYIKRTAGLPGETVAFHAGDLYVLPPEKSPKHDDRAEDDELRRLTHENDVEAVRLFRQGKFEIVRKSPELILAVSSVVYDNDHPAQDLKGPQWQRWTEDGQGWKEADGGRTFHHPNAAGKDLSWLRYEHRLRTTGGKPSLITDFTGYNSGEGWIWVDGRWQTVRINGMEKKDPNGLNWVGDLLLDCEVDIDMTKGELVLELIRGEDRFRASWDLSSEDGRCTLTRETNGGVQKLGEEPTKIRTGTYRIRFANVDQRLTVWVDDDLPFGDGLSYEMPRNSGATASDLQPAGIGATGAVSVRKLKLFRDVYYCQEANRGDWDLVDRTDPGKFAVELINLPVRTMYVQPCHYLCLGDNPLASYDSRGIGLVPERLLLGKAWVVYYPFSRARKLR